MGTGRQEPVVEAEPASFSDAPRVGRLAAHAIPKTRLALEDKDPSAVLSQPLGQGSTGKAAAHDDHVVVHRRFSLRPARSTPEWVLADQRRAHIAILLGAHAAELQGRLPICTHSAPACSRDRASHDARGGAGPARRPSRHRPPGHQVVPIGEPRRRRDVLQLRTQRTAPVSCDSQSRLHAADACSPRRFPPRPSVRHD
jgi:hypothetical protein